MRLLVIEDEVKLAEYLRKGLTEEGYVVGSPRFQCNNWRYTDPALMRGWIG